VTELTKTREQEKQICIRMPLKEKMAGSYTRECNTPNGLSIGLYLRLGHFWLAVSFLWTLLIGCFFLGSCLNYFAGTGNILCTWLSPVHSIQPWHLLPSLLKNEWEVSFTFTPDRTTEPTLV
jgi:hypothetical protein